MSGKMRDIPTKKTLSRPRRQLLELMQCCGFCRIENLKVRGGEPVFDRTLHVIHEIKLGVENAPRPELKKDDLQLPAQAVGFFDHLNRVGDGQIAIIEVRHGLPFRLLIERPMVPQDAI